MKKTLAILTLVVMLAALIVPVAMADVEARATCDHPGVNVTETNGSYSPIDASKHSYIITSTARCRACNVVVAVTNREATGTHGAKVYSVMHVEGTNYHKYKDKCVLCGYLMRDTYRVICNNSNCYIN